MSKKVMQKIVSIEKPTELSAEKVELSILDDIEKQIGVLSKGLADMKKKSSDQRKALDNATSAISKLKRANLIASKSSVQNETGKTFSIIEKAERAAKELGMSATDIKGLRQLEKLIDEIEERANLIDKIKQESKVYGDRAI